MIKKWIFLIKILIKYKKKMKKNKNNYYFIMNNNKSNQNKRNSQIISNLDYKVKYSQNYSLLNKFKIKTINNKLHKVYKRKLKPKI